MEHRRADARVCAPFCLHGALRPLARFSAARRSRRVPGAAPQAPVQGTAQPDQPHPSPVPPRQRSPVLPHPLDRLQLVKAPLEVVLLRAGQRGEVGAQQLHAGEARGRALQEQGGQGRGRSHRALQREAGASAPSRRGRRKSRRRHRGAGTPSRSQAAGDALPPPAQPIDTA